MLKRALLLFILALSMPGTTGTGSDADSSLLSAAPDEDAKAWYPESAKKRLYKSGIPKAWVTSLLADKRVVFKREVLGLNALSFQAAPDYSQFTKPEAVAECREFVKTHSETFKKAELKYAVPPQTISALMWVESKHGKVLGNYPVPACYLSMTLAIEHPWIDEIVEQAKKKNPQITTKKVKARANRKALWATEELRALFKIQKKYKSTGLDILELRGSYAGAFGLIQFLPSSYLALGTDGNGDGKVDLFDPIDAIPSAAHFLKVVGFSKSHASQKKALWAYNQDAVYGETILKLAELCKPE